MRGRPTVGPVAATSRRTGVGRALARTDAGGLLYGAVVSGAAMAATSAHASDSTRVVVSTVAVLIVYWLADVYIHVLSKQLGGDARGLPSRLRTSFGEEASVLVGGLPVVAVYVVVRALGAGPSTAATVALCFLVVLLFSAGYLGAHRAGLTGRTAFLEAGGAGCFGVLIVLMKFSLH